MSSRKQILAQGKRFFKSFAKPLGTGALVNRYGCILLVKRRALKIKIVKRHAVAQHDAAIDVIAKARGKCFVADL